MDQFHQFLMKNKSFISLSFEGNIRYATGVALQITHQTGKPEVPLAMLRKIVEPYESVPSDGRT